LKFFFDQLFLTLVYGGIVLGIFIILLINNKEVRKSRANIFLSILLMAFIFSIFHIRFAGNIIDHFSVKTFPAGDPTFLLIPPLLWFYIEELTGSKVKFSLRSLLHIVPFLFIIFCSLYLHTFSPDEQFIQFPWNHPRLTIIVFLIIVIIQFSVYQFFVRKKWQNYQLLMQQEVSNTEGISISWINFFMTVFLIIILFFLVGLFVIIHFDLMAWLWKSVGIVFSLSVFALGYKGILQKEIFFPDELKKTNPVISTSSSAKSAPDRQMIDLLVNHMHEKKSYLNPELTLSKLAEELNWSRSQLSQLINDGIGENFYDFTNKYRVEEVKRLMVDPQFVHYNLLGLALEAGFKSKSTFNLIFKRFTGLTPTEYRKNITE
jgi:AraC-like DNA-binding protein